MNVADKILCDIEDSLLKAEASYQLWWGITHHGINDYYSALNDLNYVDFFHASTPIYLQSIFICLSKIFDRAGDLSGIRSLKRELAAIGQESVSDEISAVLERNVNKIRSIKGIRDQSIGHRKTSKDADDIYTENPITPNEIKALIDDLKIVVKLASEPFERKSNVLSSQRYLDATIKLMAALNK
ncbi:hypothetical protein [Plesiomonas shigelloides]|uniref:AbiU2 domain-containing protein n=1 Tax=Plesiomonas shigelloides TaxID=703 RepID=UPI001C5B9CFB|nr:hypothetical protein [Plesiomonas shigelloides]MBW3794598.1 hypothetical protein [Plesiomonas shigelloides]